MGRERRPPATLWQRLAARLVDVVTLAWFAGFVLVELDQRLLGGDPLGRRRLELDLTDTRPLVLLVLVIGLYEVVPVCGKGATLGKALFGLRLAVVEGSGRLGPARAIARALVLYGAPVALGAYGGFVWLVIFLSLAVPASGRGLHDRLVGSVVVGASREEEKE